MVVSKSGILAHSLTKEPMLPNIPPRQMTSRIGELPSLRYGSLGVKSTFTGPLKVCAPSRTETLPRRTQKKGMKNSGVDKDPDKPARRVRFSLPPTEVAVAQPSRQSHVAGGTGRAKTASRRAPAPWRTTNYRASVCGRKSKEPAKVETFVDVTSSPGVRDRVRPTGRYASGALSPTSPAEGGGGGTAAPSQEGLALVRAARDGDDAALRDLLRRAALVGLQDGDLNACDSSGKTVLSHIASNGLIELLETIIQLPGLDPNKPDNEGNTPLHFAAQAGQIECLNCLLSRCRGVDIDARNNLGFTPLMKAALQGRNKCAKLLLFAGANPTLRDGGRGLRADQWARFCGRYVCADVIERHARQRLLERSTSCGARWGEPELAGRVTTAGGKIVPVPLAVAAAAQHHHSGNGLKSKLRKVFRTSSGPSSDFSSARLVTQLTSAALCASSPVLPSNGAVPPVVKSLIRPLTVPRLQITLANNNGDHPNRNLTEPNGVKSPTKDAEDAKVEEVQQVVKPARTKKK